MPDIFLYVSDTDFVTNSSDFLLTMGGTNSGGSGTETGRLWGGTSNTALEFSGLRGTVGPLSGDAFSSSVTGSFFPSATLLSLHARRRDPPHNGRHNHWRLERPARARGRRRCGPNGRRAHHPHVVWRRPRTRRPPAQNDARVVTCPLHARGSRCRRASRSSPNAAPREGRNCLSSQRDVVCPVEYPWSITTTSDADHGGFLPPRPRSEHLRQGSGAKSGLLPEHARIPHRLRRSRRVR